MAGGKVFSLESLLFILFGVTYHAVGFLDNNVMDYEYDKGDPAKSHFPLVKGEVAFHTADLIVKAGLVVLVLFGVWLAGVHTGALIPLAVGIISGLIYNRYNKQHLWKGIPISVCFSMIPLFSYMAVGSNPTPMVWLLVAYVFLQVYFQITVSGELKEIEAPSEKSLLRTLGVQVFHWKVGNRSTLYTTPRFYVYAYSLKMSNLLIGIFITLMTGISTILATLAATVILWFYCRPLLRGGEWNRKRRIRDMSLVEIFSYYFIIAVLGLTGYEVLFLVVIPTLWFMIFNRLMWGREHLIGPRV